MIKSIAIWDHGGNTYFLAKKDYDKIRC